MTAVADHDPFCKTQASCLVANAVDIDAGRKQIATSVVHDAHVRDRYPQVIHQIDRRCPSPLFHHVDECVLDTEESGNFLVRGLCQRIATKLAFERRVKAQHNIFARNARLHQMGTSLLCFARKFFGMISMYHHIRWFMSTKRGYHFSRDTLWL